MYTSLCSILSYPILLYTSKIKMNAVIRDHGCAPCYHALSPSLHIPAQPVALFLFLPPVNVRVSSLPSTPDRPLHPMLVLRFSTPLST
jgi:hypothetical protein